MWTWCVYDFILVICCKISKTTKPSSTFCLPRFWVCRVTGGWPWKIPAQHKHKTLHIWKYTFCHHVWYFSSYFQACHNMFNMSVFMCCNFEKCKHWTFSTIQLQKNIENSYNLKPILSSGNTPQHIKKVGIWLYMAFFPYNTCNPNFSYTTL